MDGQNIWMAAVHLIDLIGTGKKINSKNHLEINSGFLKQEALFSFAYSFLSSRIVKWF